MPAKYRTDMSSRKTIVSSDKNAGGRYTFVTDWWSEMVAVQQKQRILVVEPDDLILGLLERWLGEEGYAVVVEASLTPPQVVGNGGEPNLVIIDVPEPLGAEKIITVRQGRACQPDTASLREIQTGYRVLLSVARQLGVRNVLPKPFTRAELLSAVGESIGDP